MHLALSRPRVIGSISPDVLLGVATAYPERQAQVDIPSSTPITEVAAPLAPLLSMVRLDQPDSSAIARFDIDTRPLAPSRPQRSGGWHRDRGSDTGLGNIRYVVANALPTEFLTAGLLTRMVTGRYLAAMAISSHDKTPIGSKVFTPQPYELVSFTDHIHRSPRNPENIALPRTWLRIALIDL